MDFVALRHPYVLNSSISWTYIWIRLFQICLFSGFKQSQSVFLVDSFISWTLYWTRHLVDLIIILTLYFCGWSRQLYGLVHFIDFTNRLVHFYGLNNNFILLRWSRPFYGLNKVVHFRYVNKVVDFMDINDGLSILWT